MTERTITFQEFPLRVIDTPDGQFFYAVDVGNLLGLKNIRTSIKNFDDTEIVTDAVRKRHDIVTYRRYGTDLRRDDKIALLTGMGVAKCVFRSDHPIVKQFKTFFNNLAVNALHGEVRAISDSSQLGEINAAVVKNLVANMPPRYEHIYVIAEIPYRDRAKIGKTTDLTKRLCCLQTGTADQLYVHTVVVKPVDVNHERMLHERFADRRITGEWFKFTWDELEALNIG